MQIHSGGNQPEGAKYSRRCIRGLVASSYASRVKPMVSVTRVNEETRISDELVEPILEEVGCNLDLVIPKRPKPASGWKVSTLVGYIFNEQASFMSRPNSAQ